MISEPVIFYVNEKGVDIFYKKVTNIDELFVFKIRPELVELGSRKTWVAHYNVFGTEFAIVYNWDCRSFIA